MKATVKQKDEDKNLVLLTDEVGAEKWLPLAERVKMQYVGIGEAEVSLDKEREIVTYLKMDKSKPKPAQSFGSKPNAQKTFGANPEKPEQKKFYKTKHLVFEKLTGKELQDELDKVCENNWVIATQTHFAEGKWNAVVYCKVKPE